MSKYKITRYEELIFNKEISRLEKVKGYKLSKTRPLMFFGITLGVATMIGIIYFIALIINKDPFAYAFIFPILLMGVGSAIGFIAYDADIVKTPDLQGIEDYCEVNDIDFNNAEIEE